MKEDKGENEGMAMKDGKDKTKRRKMRKGRKMSKDEKGKGGNRSEERWEEWNTKRRQPERERKMGRIIQVEEWKKKLK